jgi:hypothetical protein
MTSLGQQTPREHKKVLVIGMLDSVHFARWLRQFENEQIDFFIYSSKKYRKTDSILLSISSTNHSARYKHVLFQRFLFISGYLDFIFFELAKKFLGLNFRSRFLGLYLRFSKFDFIHALEMQGAGYLLSSIKRSGFSGSKIIVTNWGSDIYYFKNDPQHETLIARTLAIADFYSAECLRDYSLARKYGFSGIDLPCIPNAGGFDAWGLTTDHQLPSSRKQVLVKGYGNTFGRAKLVVDLLPELIQKYPQFNFHFYSVTEDVYQFLCALPTEIFSRLKITTTKNRLTHPEMLEEFSKSRVYVGCSASDGISTSFLESLITGCYPIQSNTSCANEWVDRGAVASIIPLDREALICEIERALFDDDLVNQAAIANNHVAQNYLSCGVIQQQALKFYG